MEQQRATTTTVAGAAKAADYQVAAPNNQANDLGSKSRSTSDKSFGAAVIVGAKKHHKSSRRSHRNQQQPQHQTNASAGNRKQQPRKTYQDTTVDFEIDKYPYCIVWTPLPIVTWFIPTIGHTGIANSKGIIYDFSDDYDVTVDNFAFGTPTKFYQFHPNDIPSGAEAWDKAIQETADYYSKTRHSLFFNNCHQYIAGVLNKVKYSGRTDWSQTEVWWKITFRSTYTGFLGFVRQWWPFAVIMTGVIIFLSAAL